MLPSNALRAIATAELFELLSILPSTLLGASRRLLAVVAGHANARCRIYLSCSCVLEQAQQATTFCPSTSRLRISADTHASCNSRTLSVALQMERRERLRKILAEREAAGEGALEGAPLIGQVWCACMKACAVVHYTCLAMPFKHVLSVTLTAACRHRMRRYMPAR
jgi:hypothetical protein